MAQSSLSSIYRSHTCGELRETHVGQQARISGWVHRKRDHGNLVFIDLRDHYGITQCVLQSDSAAFAIVEGLKNETVVTFDGKVVKRSDEVINDKMPTGYVELVIEKATVQSVCQDQAWEDFLRGRRKFPLPACHRTSFHTSKEQK